MAVHLRIRKNGHMYSRRLTRNEANGYFAPAVRAVVLDPTTGEQGVRQDQGRSTIAGKAADRELEWSWYKPASAGFLLPAIFAVSSHITSRFFLTPDFPLFKGRSKLTPRGIAKGLHALEELGYFRPHSRSVVLDPSRGEQEFTRIKDDRPSPRRRPTGSRDGLGKTRFGGFFVACRKAARLTLPRSQPTA